MYESLTITCDITPTDPAQPLGLELWINDQQIFESNSVTDKIKFFHTLQLPENQEHTLSIKLKNKSSQHTVVDNTGKIIKDSTIIVERIAFDEIELGQIIPDLSVYQHDFNGNAPVTQSKFYRELGCNGTVSMKFSTPVYLWLLERI